MLTETINQEFYKTFLEKNIKFESKTRNAFHKVLKASVFDSPLGPMIAIADEKHLFLLEFVECRGLQRELEKLCISTQSKIISGMSDPILSIEQELKAYFEGNLQEFKTPLYLMGTSFQKTVWNALMHIPYGDTKSYAELSLAIGKRTAYRAAANANGANQLAIVIPCHRVINSNGALGGYAGGIERKKWLLQHEKIHAIIQ